MTIIFSIIYQFFDKSLRLIIPQLQKCYKMNLRSMRLTRAYRRAALHKAKTASQWQIGQNQQVDTYKILISSKRMKQSDRLIRDLIESSLHLGLK